MRVVSDYFDALARRDVEAMAALWAPDGDERIAGQVEAVGPSGVRTYFSELFAAFNAKTRMERRAVASRDLERVADGVWLLRGGVPRTMNVYLIEDERGGVTMFDAGIRSMTHAVAEAAAPLGGINRIVLGHADADHRGTAPGLRVPVYCHPAEVEAARSDEPLRAYHRLDKLGIPARYVYRRLMSFWDGGAVEIAGTVDEGDDVSGFRVVHLPGHAPGLIGLFRESDRLVLTSDCFYVIDPETSRKIPPGPPPDAFNEDTEQARASIRRLAALDPSAAWPGHADPLTGDVRAQLERAASA
jgi:hydroxyacylglutathione hydrolase